jgi:hypothetical protein
VNPVEGHTKLQVDARGLAALRRITDPIAPVIVIGPYRSGKSFLLNQLLGVPCGGAPDSLPVCFSSAACVRHDVEQLCQPSTQAPETSRCGLAVDTLFLPPPIQAAGCQRPASGGSNSEAVPFHLRAVA